MLCDHGNDSELCLLSVRLACHPEIATYPNGKGDAAIYYSRMDSVALPPETAEGWFALHQVLHVDRAALRTLEPSARASMRERARIGLETLTSPDDEGWTAFVDLIGSTAELMVIHFRPTIDEIGAAQRALAAAVGDVLNVSYSFLSVAEAGFYHATSQLAHEATARGGKVGDAEHRQAMEVKLAAELESAHVRKRLYPPLPTDMPYVSFYPMDKKRDAGQNWYALPIDERSRLMHAHGLTGRRYAKRVFQIITGAIGLEEWEWGVTLFARDPIDFKKLVTEMRFDEASARYGAFGRFFVGRVVDEATFLERVGL